MVRPTVPTTEPADSARGWVWSSEALRLLKVHRKTLLSWARMGSIPTRVLPSRARDPDDPRQRRVHRLFDVGTLVPDEERSRSSVGHNPPPLRLVARRRLRRRRCPR